MGEDGDTARDGRCQVSTMQSGVTVLACLLLCVRGDAFKDLFYHSL